MKICIFGDERAIHTRRWVEGLRSLGIHVDLITLVKEKQYDIGGISLGSQNKVSYIFKISRLRELIKKLDPDILHAHHASSFGFLSSFIDHPAKVLSVWGYDVITFPYKNFITRAMIKRSLRHSHYITATSEYLRQAVLELDSSLSRIEVIPFGVDIQQFKYCQREQADEIIIGIAKSLRPVYGIDKLIRAFAMLKNKFDNVRLIIAGKGEFEAEYKKLVKELGVEQLVEFSGFLDHSKLPVLLSSLDIFVMPSIKESFGVAALEASATGLPVVASDVGGVPEVVQDNVTGLLVPRKNVDALAGALSKLIDNPGLRRVMGRAGRKFVEENYSWDDNLKAMKRLYEKIFAERRK